VTRQPLTRAIFKGDGLPVFFNLLSEVEPFAEILTAQGTLGGFLRSEGPKFEAKDQEQRRDS